jgi:superfamily II DNA or RNA helicase
MASIAIKKLDNVNIKVSGEPSILQELNQHFSFEAPGAKFHPLYRAKKWDGRLRMFHLLSGNLPVGLLGYLEHFCEVNNYTIDYEEYYQEADTATIEQVRKFCQSLDLSLPQGQSIRDYQVEAVYQAINSGRRLLLSPTSSGKSCILYCLIRWHEQFNRQQLIIVPTTSLCLQMKSDFKSYSLNNGWDGDEVRIIMGGEEKDNTSAVTVSTWQSLYDLPKKFFANFDVVYGDECHLFKSKSLTGIMNKCVNTPYRVGTTGTLDGTKANKLVIEGAFGPVYKVITTKELMDSNQIANLKIFAIILDYDDQIKKANKDLKYQEEMDFLVQHEPRNKYIRNLTLSQTGNTLVLFQYVEKHGKILFDMINDKDSSRQVFFVYGGTDAEQRENIRQITEGENDAIIIGSYGCMSTGINIRNLHNIVFASPSKSRIRNLQSIGRGLRKGDEKVECKLYDIGDDMTWKTRKNYTLHHMVERIKIYNDEQFSYQTVKVPL